MRVVYFDGVCNLCNSFVDFLIRRDPEHLLKFAPLQGETAAQRLPAELRESLGTVVFEDADGRFYVRSAAALRAIASLGGALSAARALLVVPPSVRDAIYRVVASNRYKWFGQRDTCRLPTAEERAQFLG